jgi:hypothetical protein
MHGKIKNTYTILVGRDHFGNVRKGWRIILKWSLEMYALKI